METGLLAILFFVAGISGYLTCIWLSDKKRDIPTDGLSDIAFLEVLSKALDEQD